MDKSQSNNNGRRESTSGTERAHSEKPTNKIETNKIPPDGGWGWMIVIAYALANAIIIPVLQSFGLIFRDLLHNLNMTATDASVIINVNSAFGMSMGLFNGPLLRTFGYRKLALAAGTFFSVGLILTSWANSFLYFILTYSIIVSMGFGMSASSFSLALNSYFRLHRNKAAGIAMTLTGLGPIFFPQMVSLLLNQYGVQGCCLIIGGISLHIIVAACLLRPIKWYLKDGPIEMVREMHPMLSDVPEDDETENISASKVSLNKEAKKVHDSNWSLSSEEEDDYLERHGISIDHDIDKQTIYGWEMTPQIRHIHNEPPKFTRSMSQMARSPHMQQLTFNRSSSVEPRPRSNSFAGLRLTIRKWYESGSQETVNLGSSLKIFDEKINEPKEVKTAIFPSSAAKIVEKENKILEKIRLSESNLLSKIAKEDSTQNMSGLENLNKTKQHKPKTFKKYCKRALRRTVKFFDLGLLRDKIYVNIMLGMSLAIFAEINFSLLTPFILSDLKLSNEEIASFMSLLAIADIVFRFLSPFIGDYLNQPPRFMYMYSLIMLIITRTSLLFANSYNGMIMVAIGLGISKGVRSVYMNLVIPSYIPIERLASASGIQMMTNGFFLLSLGPLLGVIRDVTGSYSRCIILINVVTFTTIIIWSIEMLYMHYIKKSSVGIKPKY